MRDPGTKFTTRVEGPSLHACSAVTRAPFGKVEITTGELSRLPRRKQLATRTGKIVRTLAVQSQEPVPTLWATPTRRIETSTSEVHLHVENLWLFRRPRHRTHDCRMQGARWSGFLYSSDDVGARWNSFPRKIQCPVLLDRLSHGTSECERQ